MNTATTTPTSSTNGTLSRKRSPVLTHAQTLDFQGSRMGPRQTPVKRRNALAGMATPRTGSPRPGGHLARFIDFHPGKAIFEDGLAYVSIEGEPHRRAILGAGTYNRLTANDPYGPRLTKTRWWLDDDGLLRAFSLHELPLSNGVLVAAAILDAREGEAIETPSDPFDLRPEGLRKVSGDPAKP